MLILNALKGRQGAADDSLKGGADQSGLQGSAQEDGDVGLTPHESRKQAGKPILRRFGNAV